MAPVIVLDMRSRFSRSWQNAPRAVSTKSAIQAACLASLVLAAIAALGLGQGVFHLASSLGSTVIVAYVFPDSPFARLRSIVGGHIVASLIGLVTAALFGESPFAAALAVGVSIVAMHLLRVMQPPAGGDPILIVLDGQPFASFVAVATGSVLIALFVPMWRRHARKDREGLR